MLKNLFSSNVRIAILKELLLNPQEEFYVRELAKIIEVTPRYTNIELKNLLEIELVNKRISGNQHLYKINKKHPLYVDIKNIFLKTVGLVDVLSKHLVLFKGKFDYAFVYGSMVRGNYTSESDVDLMLIGNVSSLEISGACSKIGEELKREVNYSVFDMEEIRKRLKNEDHFLTSLLREPKLFIFGDPDEFTRLAK